MFKIKKTDYGLRMDFVGGVNQPDMEDWLKQSKDTIEEIDMAKFAVLIDFRYCDYLAASGKKTFDTGRKVFYHMGMRRSALIFAEPKMSRGFKRIAKRLGFDQFERYLDSTNPRCEKLALAWLLRGDDPDLSEEERDRRSLSR
ncbi:MAG: hypothetical protein GY835_27180 [bacterium]|nr:hypothetical protein [bacterium]